MAEIYTIAKVGRTREITPEGFLLCRGVRIARSQPMAYASHELPKLKAKNGLIMVERDPNQVFNKDCVSTFEGKPIVITHDAGLITPDNVEEASIGHMQNVRRGEGHEAGDLFADLLITKRRGIDLVSKRLSYEVSPGYVATYDQVIPGKARQTALTGNHLALVESGRCGISCAIGDSAMTMKKGKRPRLAPGAAKMLALDAAMGKVRRAIMTNDEEGLAEALGEIDEVKAMEESRLDNGVEHEMGTGEPGVNLTINVSGAGVSADPGGAPPKPQATTDDLDLGDNGGASPDIKAAVMEAIAPLVAEISAIKKAIGMEAEPDGDEELMGDADEEEDDDVKDKKFTMDANAVRAFHQDVMAKAAILIPGAKVLTLDGKMTARQAWDAVCDYRKAAVVHAAQAPATAGLLQPMLNGRNPAALTCDQAGMAFDAAAAVMRQQNNAQNVQALTGAMQAGQQQSQQQPKGPMRVTDRLRQMNERNRKRYGYAN